MFEQGNGKKLLYETEMAVVFGLKRMTSHIRKQPRWKVTMKAVEAGVKALRMWRQQW